MNGWIDINDHMPEVDDGRCIFWAWSAESESSHFATVFLSPQNDRLLWYSEDGKEIEGVTHWKEIGMACNETTNQSGPKVMTTKEAIEAYTDGLKQIAAAKSVPVESVDREEMAFVANLIRDEITRTHFASVASSPCP
jgi:hypothetical protein